MKKILPAVLLILCLLTSAACAEVVPLPMDFSPGMKPTVKYPGSYQEYEDPSITATYEMVPSKEWNVTYWLCRVKIADPSQLRTAAANGFDKKGTMSTQTLARRMNAIVAINGDYYTGDAGRYVLRQGQVFRDNMSPGQDLLLIDEDGDFHIILSDEKPEGMDKTVIDGKKVVNALCFGPALVRDGEIVADVEKAQRASNPKSGEQRIAIAQTGPLEYLVVTVARWGMTLEGFARFVQSLGVQQAYNLDGGNSCHMIFMGNWKNKLADSDYRAIPDIVYFASAWQE